MLVGGSHAQINGRQNRENVRLNDGHENVQADKRDGNRGGQYTDNNT